jgi:hypothetical protein
MQEATADKNQTTDIYIALLAFLLLVAAARTAYVSGTPLSNNIDCVPPLIFLGIGAFYTFWCDNPVVAGLFNALGLICIAFTGAYPSAALIVYTGRGFPLIDASLVAFDQALGFDWVGYVKWFDRHPLMASLGEWAYQSISVQPFAIITVLVLVKQVERMYGLIAMMVVALTITTVIALFLPALGAYPFFQLSPADHPNISIILKNESTAPIEWLRSAAFDRPRPPIPNGLISFPSYHAATALLYIWAAWRTPVLKWIVLALNIAMLIATPLHGSHYLIDVIGGAAVAFITIRATQWAFTRLRRTRPMLVEAQSPS